MDRQRRDAAGSEGLIAPGRAGQPAQARVGAAEGEVLVACHAVAEGRDIT
jgi:hypothetical protein